MIKVLSFLLSGWICCSVLALEQSTVLSLSNGEYNVPAVLVVPMSSAPVPAVLLLHGTASNKNEVGNLYGRLAEQLAQRGIASLRIDFAGTGDSEVDYLKYTLESALRDARLAFSRMSSHPKINSERLGLVGFSQGGLIAQLLVAKETNVKSFVAWSSVASDGMGPFASLFETHYLSAKSNGYAVQEYAWRSSLSLSLAWFEQVLDNRSLSELGQYTGSLLAIAGSNDQVVPPESAMRLVRAAGSKQARAVIIKGANHIFNVLDEQASQDEVLLQITANWFSDML